MTDEYDMADEYDMTAINHQFNNQIIDKVWVKIYITALSGLRAGTTTKL